MKAIEFEGSLNPDSTLTVPAQVAQLLPHDQPMRVLLLIPEGGEAQEWERLAAEQFLQGYAESDAVYDDLPAG